MASSLKLKNINGYTHTISADDSVSKDITIYAPDLAKTKTVDTVAELVALDTNKYDRVWLLGYHTKGDIEPKLYQWYGDEDVDNHNGGTIIAFNRTFPTDWSNSTQLLYWYDTTVTSGITGCWKTAVSGSVNVKDFGAKSIAEVGYENYDSTSAIQNALNIMGDIHIPNGVYKITDILIIGSNTSVIGDGKGSTLIELANDKYIYFTGAYSSIRNLQIHKVTPTANFISIGSVTEYPTIAPRFTCIDNCKFDADSFPTFTNYAVIGNYKSFDVKVTNCLIETFHAGFITKYFDSQRVTIENNIFQAATDSGCTNVELCKIEAVKEGYINNNTMYLQSNSSPMSCITLESGSEQVIVSNNKIINDNGSYGIRIADADSPGVYATECIIENNIITSDISSNSYCIHAGYSAISKFNINNNTLNGKSMLYLKDCVIDSNYIYGVGDTSNNGVNLRADNLIMKNNSIRGFNIGIMLDSTSTGLMSNFMLDNNYLTEQSNDSVVVKNLDGICLLVNNTIINQALSGNGAIYAFAGGASADIDTLTISNNSIISTSIPGVRINYMNGVTIKKNNISATTKYSFTSSDVYLDDDQRFPSSVFTDATSRINTKEKIYGKQSFDYTLWKPLWAKGPLATDVWVDATGTTVHTPS